MAEGFALPADIDSKRFFETLRKMREGVKELAQDMEDVGGIKMSRGGGGRGMISGQGVSTATPGSGAGGLGYLGPMGKYDQMYVQYKIAQHSGQAVDPDFQYKMLKAFEARQRMMKQMDPYFGSGLSAPEEALGEHPLMRMLLSSRFKIGGVAMPLGRDMLRAVGLDQKVSQGGSAMIRGAMGGSGDMAAIAESALPVLIPLTIIALAGSAMAAIIGKGLEVAVPMMNASYRSGGYGAEGGTGYAYGRGVGSDAGSAAVQAGEALRKGGVGAAIAHANGIYDFGPYTVDKMKNYNRLVDLISSPKLSRDQATMVARDMGMDRELQYRDMSGSIRGAVRDSGAISGMSDEDRKMYADYGGVKQVAGNMWDAFWMKAGSYAIKMGEWGIDAALGPLGSPFHSDTQDNGKSAIDKNTEAIKNHTRVLKEGTDAVGLGPRSRNALPLMMRNKIVQQAAQNQTMFNGGFAVG